MLLLSANIDAETLNMTIVKYSNNVCAADKKSIGLLTTGLLTLASGLKISQSSISILLTLLIVVEASV